VRHAPSQLAQEPADGRVRMSRMHVTSPPFAPNSCRPRSWNRAVKERAANRASGALYAAELKAIEDEETPRS